MSHNHIVTIHRVPLAAAFAAATTAILMLGGCAKDINNKEAVRAAVIDYLNQKAQTTGLNVASMDVVVASVSFEKDQAQAMVSIKPKGMGEGMQMTYALVRKGDKWAVKSKQDSGSNPHGGEIPPSGGGAATPSNPAMPPNHPPAASK